MGTTEPKRCLGCGYILEHLPEPRCPECGRRFDPDNPKTYRLGAPRGALAAAARASLTAVLIVASAVVGSFLGSLIPWQVPGRYILKPAEQAVAAFCVMAVGFALCWSRRWRVRELLAGLAIVETLVLGVVCCFAGDWDGISAGPARVADLTSYEGYWFLWASKFVGAPFLLPILCRAMGLIPPRCRRRAPGDSIGD